MKSWTNKRMDKIRQNEKLDKLKNRENWKKGKV